MAESVETQGTSLQFRLLGKRIAKLEGAVPAARAHRVAVMQGLAEPALVMPARQNDPGTFEKWLHP